jgi:hypothetical protein
MLILSSQGSRFVSFFLTGDGDLLLPKQAQITLKKRGHHSLFAVDARVRLFTEKAFTFT